MNQLHYSNIDAYSDFFEKWNWHWFATLTFEHKANQNTVDSLRLRWTRDLCTIEKIQVAYFYVKVNESGHPHLHLLMIGSSKKNKTLLDVDPLKWESAWPYRAHIFIPDSNVAVAKYFTKNIAQYGSEYDTYNSKLLTKCIKNHL